jgi:uncharacterized protein (DUF1810 family)
MVEDPFNLQRFVDAQSAVFKKVCSELASGQKVGHWMWYIFPQLQGLGHSSTARHYAISSLPEAQAYLAHPVLGLRLKKCASLVISIEGTTIEQIFGDPDYLKFRSSMTLFAHATQENQVFLDALKKYFGGVFDNLTIQLLRKA